MSDQERIKHLEDNHNKLLREHSLLFQGFRQNQQRNNNLFWWGAMIMFFNSMIAIMTLCKVILK